MLSLSALLVSGCAAAPALVKPVLEEEGEVYVYLQPLPQEAGRLKFTLDHLSLVSSDGNEFPLSLSLAEVNSDSARTQRFVATGRVPPGRYRGLSYGVKKATLRGDEGEAVLLVPGAGDNGLHIRNPEEAGRRSFPGISVCGVRPERVQFLSRFLRLCPGYTRLRADGLCDEPGRQHYYGL